MGYQIIQQMIVMTTALLVDTSHTVMRVLLELRCRLTCCHTLAASVDELEESDSF